MAVRLVGPYVSTVGDLCWNGYWQEYYLVLTTDNSSGSVWERNLWLGNGKFANSRRDQRVTHHCTPFDGERGDRLIARNLFDSNYPSYNSLVRYLLTISDHDYQVGRHQRAYAHS